MAETGKLLAIVGGLLLLSGAVLWGLGAAGFRGLPGDLRYERDNIRVYFPIVTCLVLSALLTAFMWLAQWLSRR